MSDSRGTRPSSSGVRAPRLVRDPETAARREFLRRVLRATLVVDAVVLVTIIGVLLAWKLREVLLLILISVFLTLLLHPVVSFVERRGVRRGLATGVVFVLAIVVLATILFVILNPLVNAAEHLAKQLPVYIRQAEHGKGTIGHYVKKFHLAKYVTSKNGGAQSLISKLTKPALSIGKGVLSGVVGLIAIVFLTFFLLIHAPRIFRGILDWMQDERADRVRGVVSDVERSVVGYMAGDLATSLVAGIVITVTLLATGVPYPVVLGIWVAIVDFLPLVGGLLAGLPTVVIAALHSIPAGVITLIVFLVYQEVENHVLYPIIMSRTVRLNSLWVLIAVLVGAELGDIVGSVFGAFVGALLAVPGGSAVQVIARDLWEHRAGTLLATATAPPVSPSAEGTEELDTGDDSTPDAPAGEEDAPPAAGDSTARDGARDVVAAGRARDRERRRQRKRPPGPPR